MAKYENPKSILGLKPWIVGSSEAPRLHGMNVGHGQKYDKAPRFKNQFFVHFQFAPQVSFNTGNDFVKGVSYRVISFDAPKFDIDTEVLNQYNKRRIIPTKINFSPVNISFHDDKSATVQSFWTFIYEYYFKDGAYGTGTGGEKTPTSYTVDSSTKINEEIGRGLVKTALPYDYFGYNLHNKETEPNLFKYISLYLVANQRYTRIDVVNPYLTNFAHDTFSQEEHSSHAQLTTTWIPETVVYVADNKAIETGDEKLKSFLGFDTQGNNDNSIFNHYTADQGPGATGATSFSVKQVEELANTKITFVKRPASGKSDQNPTISSSRVETAGGHIEKLIQSKTRKSIDSWNVADISSFETEIDNSTNINVDSLGSQTAVASSIQGLFPGIEPEQSKKLATSMINAAIPRADSSELQPARKVRDVPAANDFAELKADLHLITTPSLNAGQGIQDAMAGLQKGKTAAEAGLVNALSAATSVDDFGSIGKLAAGVSPMAGETGSLLGGTASLISSPPIPMSRIGHGSLLPNISGLNQGLAGLNAISQVVSIFAGGNSFGKFSTGLRTLGNISQALATADLRRVAIEVGRTGGVFAPKVSSPVPFTRQGNVARGSGLSVIDVITAVNALSRRVAGSNLNNTVVSSSRTAAKPWVNPDVLGLKTVNTGFISTNDSLSSGVFNNTFGPRRSVQNQNIRGW